jgi:cation transport regulator ChaC
MSLAVFGYGSLVLAESASMTLGRPVGATRPAALQGWRRRFSQCRDNLAVEKTFALADGTRPRWILGLNVEQGEDDAGPVNGALIELEGQAELDRLALRELRYLAVEVTPQIEAGGEVPTRVFVFTARPEQHAPAPPDGAVILASYARAVEAAFTALGEGELERFRETTGPYPVERVEATLVEDAIPEGNPRAW